MPGIPPSPKRKEKHFLAWHGAVHLYRTWEDEAGDLEFEVSLVYTMIISPSTPARAEGCVHSPEARLGDSQGTVCSAG